MARATIRFLDFMDARPLPDGQARMRLVVVPRFHEVVGGAHDDARPRPGDDPGGMPMDARHGRQGPDTKPTTVVVPDFRLAESFVADAVTDQDGSATSSFSVNDAFRRLAEARRDDQVAVDVLAHLHVAFRFMGITFDEQRIDDPITSAGQAVSHDLPVDFGMSAVGHTTTTTTRLWFSLNQSPTSDHDFRCVVAIEPVRDKASTSGIAEGTADADSAGERARRDPRALRPLDELRSVAGDGRPAAALDVFRVVHDDEVEIQEIDATATSRVDGLVPGASHRYELRVTHEGREFPLLLGTFATAADDDRDLTFSFGSCHLPTVPIDVSDAREAAGRRLDRWHHLSRRRDDDLLLLTGDQVYGDGLEDKWPDLHFIDRYQRRYRQLWAYWPMRDVLRRTPTYMILDDHDVADDFGTAVIEPEGRVPAALEVYRRFQHARNPGGPDGTLHYAFRRGPAAFFVMDVRTGRTPGRPGMIDQQQFDDLRAWASSADTRDADVVFLVTPIPMALLPTELARRIAEEVAEIVEEKLESSLTRAGFLVGAGIGGLVAGPAGAMVGGLVLGAVGHVVGDQVAEAKIPDTDSLLLAKDLAERWDLAGTQPQMVEVLDLLFDLANGVGEAESRRRAVFVLAGDIHVGTMHLLRSLPVANGRRHDGNPELFQLTSSALSHPPVDEAAFGLAIERLDEDFRVTQRDVSLLKLWEHRDDIGGLADDPEILAKLDELLGTDPAAYALDSEGEQRFWTQFAGLVADHNVGAVHVHHVGPGRRYRFDLSIDGRSDSLQQHLEVDLESDADVVPRFDLGEGGTVRIYVTVRRRRPGGAPEPLSGVRVRVVDQDAPAPPGDDVVPPDDGTTITTTPKVITTVSTSFAPPTEDEVLADGRTDRFGTVWLYLSRADVLTTAGTVTTTTTTDRLGTFPGRDGPVGRPGGRPDGGPAPRPSGGGTTQSHTSRRSLTERRPDLYFLLTLPDGRTVDTRDLDDGLFTNVSSTVGTAEEPVTFVVEQATGPADRPDVGDVATQATSAGSGGPTPGGGQDPDGAGPRVELPDLPPRVIVQRPGFERRPRGPGGAPVTR